MKYSLIQLVQKVLSAMDSDRVDTIDDTEESVQVAELARDVYYEIINDREWPFLNGALSVTSPSDTARPTALDITDETRRIDYVAYNIARPSEPENYSQLRFMEPLDFIRAHSGSGDDKLLVTAGNNLRFYVTTNRQPTVWTSFDDGTIYLNSVDNGVESVVQPSKVSVMGYRIPAFTIEDDHVPELPTHFFPLLLAEVKKAAFRYFKNEGNARDAQIAVSQRAQLQRQASRSQKSRYFNTNFGRR